MSLEMSLPFSVFWNSLLEWVLFLHCWSHLGLECSLGVGSKLESQFIWYRTNSSFLFFSWVLLVCIFQNICLFHLCYQIYWHKVFIVLLYYHFNIFMIYGDTTLLLLVIIVIFLFFLFNLAKSLLFCWYPKITNFWLYWVLLFSIPLIITLNSFFSYLLCI